MRHLKNRNKLGVKTSHRMAMVRNLVTQLLEHKQIMTTLARAKNIRTPVDKMVVLAKKNDLASKKRIFSFVKSKVAVKMLYEQYAEVYKTRQSGFTQIYKLKNTKFSEQTQKTTKIKNRVLHLLATDYKIILLKVKILLKV